MGRVARPHPRRFLSWATVAIVLTLRFNSPQLGLVAGRQLHLLPVLDSAGACRLHLPVCPGGAIGRGALVAVVALFVAVPYTAVPHVADVRQFNPALIERVQQAGGHLVLLENNPHWDMIGDPVVRTERRASTCTTSRSCRRPPDGSSSDNRKTAPSQPFRGSSLAGGGLGGLAIDAVPTEALVDQLRRWGVEHLFVWSARAQQHLASRPEFMRRWQHGDWQESR